MPDGGPPQRGAATALDQALFYAQDLARLQATPRSFLQRVQQAEGARFKILVVDDEPSIRQLLLATLDRGTYELLEASTGSEALQQARIAVPDLVLLDVKLPDSSGLAVCARLKADPLLCNIPVVLVTAAGTESDREAGLAAGAAYYVTKPFSPLQLMALIRQLLGEAA